VTSQDKGLFEGSSRRHCIYCKPSLLEPAQLDFSRLDCLTICVLQWCNENQKMFCFANLQSWRRRFFDVSSLTIILTRCTVLSEFESPNLPPQPNARAPSQNVHKSLQKPVPTTTDFEPVQGPSSAVQDERAE